MTGRFRLIPMKCTIPQLIACTAVQVPGSRGCGDVHSSKGCESRGGGGRAGSLHPPDQRLGRCSSAQSAHYSSSESSPTNPRATAASSSNALSVDPRLLALLLRLRRDASVPVKVAIHASSCNTLAGACQVLQLAPDQMLHYIACMHLAVKKSVGLPI